MSDNLWYYAENDATKGPLSFEDLVETLKKMSRLNEVLIWRQGFEDWVEASSIPELDRLLIRPPPLPNKRPVSPLSPEYRQAEPPEQKNARWKVLGPSLVGWVIGIGLARLLGGVFWIPALLIWLSYWAFSKLKVSVPVTLMLSVLVGHTLWMVVGHISLLMMNTPSPDLAWFPIDLVAVLLASIWCAKKESVLSCLFVFLYQLCALGVILANLEAVVKASEVGAFMHVSLRVIGLGLSMYAGVKMRKRRGRELEELRAPS
jgi:hypothetical protein